MENKQKICELLLACLRQTRGLHDLEALVYAEHEDRTEYVTAVFASGNTKSANVTMDSGVAMIWDILRQIV